MRTIWIARKVWLAAVLSVAAWAGEPKPPVVHQREAPKPAAPKAAAKLPDSQIEAAIRARLAKSKIDADHFQVRVQGGVAYLEGRTDVVQHKGVATRMAKSAGAASVVNHIQVSPAGKAKVAANLEKGRRRAQITRGEARTSAEARK